MSQLERDRAEKKFSLERFIDEHESLYNTPVREPSVLNGWMNGE
jgi:hypothetical protein